MLHSGYDVIVIGGGPAGSLTGYHLAKAGLRVAILDAKRFPREKPCGGGLQARAARTIPFDLTHLLRGTMRNMALSFALNEPLIRTYTEPLVYSVLRTEFDHYLLECSQRAGAAVFEGVRIHGFEAGGDGRAFVRTEAGDFEADCLVGADGANSVVSRLLNNREDYFWQAGVYCEVPEELLNGHSISRECMRIDWGSLPSGYAWAFPKRGYVNIGAGGPVKMARFLKRYAAAFARSTHIVKAGALERLTFVGHQLPTLTRRTRVAGRNVLLVGDAAGLVEPFTGDGLSLACHSARLAAETIREALGSGSRDVSVYDGRLKSEVDAELFWSRKVLALSTAFPSLVHRLFRHNDAVWLTFCRILRGEDSFQRLKKEILGPLEFAWKAIELVTERRERKVLGAPDLPGLLRQSSL